MFAAPSCSGSFVPFRLPPRISALPLTVPRPTIPEMELGRQAHGICRIVRPVSSNGEPNNGALRLVGATQPLDTTKSFGMTFFRKTRSFSSQRRTDRNPQLQTAQTAQHCIAVAQNCAKVVPLNPLVSMCCATCVCFYFGEVKN